MSYVLYMAASKADLEGENRGRSPPFFQSGPPFWNLNAHKKFNFIKLNIFTML